MKEKYNETLSKFCHYVYCSISIMSIMQACIIIVVLIMRAKRGQKIRFSYVTVLRRNSYNYYSFSHFLPICYHI